MRRSEEIRAAVLGKNAQPDDRQCGVANCEAGGLFVGSE
jgi:hypothetical protein